MTHYFEFGVQNFCPVEKTAGKMETVYVQAESSPQAIRYMEQKIEYDHFIYRQAVPGNCLLNGIEVLFAAPFENYVIFYDERTGEEFYEELNDDTPLDLYTLAKEWVQKKWCGELELEEGVCDHGEITATIKLNWTRPDSVHCWTSGSFYFKSEV